MTTKWTIRKYPIRWDGSRPNCPWLVFYPGITPQEDYEKAFLFADDVFHTFPEALAYVDSRTRKTRTVEVELPEVVREAELISEPYAELIVLDQVDGNVRVTAGDQALYLLDSDLKPLGEYLLALHYEKENK